MTGKRSKMPIKRRAGRNMKVISGTFELIAVIITVTMAVALFIAVLAPFINPNAFWMPSFFGLAAPIIYLINLIALLFWIMRWRIYFVVPLFVLMIGIGHVGNFFQPKIGKVYDDKIIKKQRNEFVFMTYNVCGFMKKNSDGEYVSTTREVLRHVNEQNPDIVAFQEFQTTYKYPQEYIDSMMSDYPYKKIYYAVSNNTIGIGLAVYSKFMIVKSDWIRYNEATLNSSMELQLLVNRRDTLRVLNNHLQTTRIDEGNIKFVESGIINNPDKKEKIHEMGRKLRDNFRIRADQADSLAKIVAADNMRTIVCGDLNDTPVSYTYRSVRGDYHDAFRTAGRGYGWTYKQLFGILCIDYIFYSDGLNALSFNSPNLEESDHNPLITRFKFDHF